MGPTLVHSAPIKIQIRAHPSLSMGPPARYSSHPFHSFTNNSHFSRCGDGENVNKGNRGLILLADMAELTASEEVAGEKARVFFVSLFIQKLSGSSPSLTGPTLDDLYESINAWLSVMHRFFKFEEAVFLFASVLFRRLFEDPRLRLELFNVKQVLCTILLVAHKVSEDVPYNNRCWSNRFLDCPERFFPLNSSSSSSSSSLANNADFGVQWPLDSDVNRFLSLAELNHMETEFLVILEWRLTPTPTEIEAIKKEVDIHSSFSIFSN